MMCYHGYRTDNGQGMRMLPGRYDVIDTIKPCVSHKLLTEIDSRLSSGEELPGIARELGVSYYDLRAQLKRNGFRFKALHVAQGIPLDRIELFISWIAKQGLQYVREGGKVLYRVKLNKTGRRIMIVDGMARLDQGLKDRYRKFCAESGIDP